MTDRKRVLVVEDDEPIRTMLAKVVGRNGVEVDTASDGAEAIERLDDDEYDAVILDLMMPRVDGFGVLRYMLEHHPGILPRTIIASAVPESEVLKHFEVPVFSVHGKPFDLQKLLGDVRKASEGLLADADRLPGL